MTTPIKFSPIGSPKAFKVYVEKLIDKQRRLVERREKSPRYLNDDLKIINLVDDGLLAFLGYYPIDAITTSTMRDLYLLCNTRGL